MTPATDSRSDRSQQHTTLESLLRAELVTSVFQPIVDLQTGRVAAFEALARGPEGPWRSPAALFTAAREEDLLAQLDLACGEAALRGAARNGLVAPATIFVNIEPEVLEDAALRRLRELCDQVPGGLTVVLEITERALAARPAELLQSVERVRQLGWGVALDDVGADVASLAFMPLLRPDVVKLDLRLVQGRATPEVAHIMNAVNAYAESTGALILAEGIENETHLETARGLGATLGQGWLFGRPTADPDVTAIREPLLLPRNGPTVDLAHRSPFACLPVGTPLRTASKRLLVELSKQLEREAMRVGETCVVASTFQQGRHFTPATAQRYRDLVDRAFFVCAIGEDLPEEPVPGLRGASLRPDDPVLGEWDVAVLGPHFSAALLARDLGDTGPDMQRRFEYALTYERDTVIAATRQLLSRVVPRAETSDPPAPPTPAPAASTGFRRPGQPRASVDPLTGLWDRRRLEERVEVELWDTRVRDGALALLLLDLDDFAAVNDSLGHPGGDEVLKVTARRLSGSIRRSDFVARLGGDQFLVAATGLDPADAHERAHNIADVLAAAVREPIRVGDAEVVVVGRVGVSVFPDDGAEFGRLLRLADLRLYDLKHPAP